MKQTIFLNDRFVAPNEARVSVFDHGFLYGDGVFEGIRAYDGRVFRLEEHVERLFRSARAIMLELPYTPGQVAVGPQGRFCRKPRRPLSPIKM